MEYKENIETAIKTLEALVKKMADSRDCLLYTSDAADDLL